MTDWKTNKNGWRTKTLFVEHLGIADQEKFQPPYTLKEVDYDKNGKVYISLYRLFMESVDEWDFATKHLGGTAHLQSLRKSKWFSDGHRTHKGYDAWVRDMKARDQSLAKKALLQATAEGKTAAASKLADMSKTTHTETKRGRFVKDEAIKEAVKKAEDSEFLEDAAIRLNVVKIRD